jgi:hypothetical protein
VRSSCLQRSGSLTVSPYNIQLCSVWIFDAIVASLIRLWATRFSDSAHHAHGRTLTFLINNVQLGPMSKSVPQPPLIQSVQARGAHPWCRAHAAPIRAHVSSAAAFDECAGSAIQSEASRADARSQR